jgi:hypothetical protein
VLFTPDRHEHLADRRFSEAAAREAIARIAARAERELEEADGRWPLDRADALDEEARPESGLYCGAAGVAWALDELAAEGYVAPGVVDRELVEALEARTFDDPVDPDLGVDGVWGGVAGVLAVAEHRWPDAARRDRLAGLARASLESPALEPMQGHPGHMVLAAQLHARTGEERWAALWSAGAERLLEEWRHDEALGAWLWTQRLGANETRYLGAAHGLAGNVHVLRRGGELLPAGRRDEVERRAVETLSRLAVVEDGRANWPGLAGNPLTIRGRIRVQWCHGAAGVLTAMWDAAPDDEAWSELLLAAGQLVWEAGPLRDAPGLCHGTAGSAYALLAMWRRTGDEQWLERARAFAQHAAGPSCRFGRKRATSSSATRSANGCSIRSSCRRNDASLRNSLRLGVAERAEVTCKHTAITELPYAGPGEDLLHEDSTGQNVREDEAEHRHDRWKRRPQDVARDHDPLRKTFRARGANVVIADDLEDGRARVTGEQADVEGSEHERRKHEVVQSLREEPPLTGEQRVDRVQPGFVRRWQHSGVEPFGAGEPSEPKEAEVERDEGDPERRHRDAPERDHTQDVIGGSVPAHGCDHAEGNPEDIRDDDRIQRELRGSGDELAEVVRHCVVRQRGLPEIALNKMLEVEPVADGQRLVEPVMSFECRYGSGVAGGLLAEVGRHGVARHQLGEHEDDERYSHREQDEGGCTAEQEAQEARRGTGPTPCPRRVGHGGRRRRQGLTIVARRATTPLAPGRSRSTRSSRRIGNPCRHRDCGSTWPLRVERKSTTT